MEFEPIPLLLSLILGFIPLVIGLKRKKTLYASVGCLSTVLISGAMHLVVAVGICLLFTWLILKVEQDTD